MTIQTTRWSPDTCECIIEYNWDNSVAENERIHSPKNIVKKCLAHQSLPDIDSLFNVIMDENPRKNMAIHEIITSSVPSIINSNENISWEWEGDAPNRKLILKVNGLSNDRKETLQSIINDKIRNVLIK